MALYYNGKLVAGRGQNGADGMSPYEAAVSAGYKGTETELNQELAVLPDISKKADAALPKTGGMMTGNLVAANPAVGVLGAANQVYVAGDAAIGDQPNGTTVFRYEVV